jgi:hypothetical protein
MVYVENQTPFIPFCISRLPVFWAQQIILLPVMLLSAWGLFALLGTPAAYIVATPLYSVMATQPSTDIYMFALMITGLLAIQQCRQALAVALFGLAFWAKPLVLLFSPVLVWSLGLWSIMLFASFGIYYVWAYQYPFGHDQLFFLLRQLYLVRKQGGSVQGAMRWRHQHITRRSLPVSPLWLFPVFTKRFRIIFVGLLAAVFIGYGNIKYLLPCMLFAYPLQEGV